MVHRDVKPQNVLVDRGDFALLADFGLTRALGDQGHDPDGGRRRLDPLHLPGADSRAGAVREDPISMPSRPSSTSASPGQPPFTGNADAAVIYGHMSEPPPRISDARPDLSPALDAVVARGLAKDPDQRYATARELVDAATSALSSPAGAAPEDATGVLAPPAARPRARRLLLAGAAVGLIALAALGFVVGSAGSGESTEEAGFVGAGPIGLSLPAGWERREERPTIPGLALSDAVSVGPAAGGSGLLAGRTQAGGPTLLPDAFRRSTRLPKKTAVRLGEFEAYTYRRIRGNGIDGRLTIYAVPTTGGVVTLGCLASPTARPDAEATCERVASTLELSGVKAYPLGPSASLGASLRTTIASLDATRLALRRILRSARTPAAQADAARELADAFGSASGLLARLAVSPEAEPAKISVVGALKNAQAAYARLARAAGSGRRPAYAAAAVSVTASEQRLARTLRNLSALGYEIAA